MRVVGLASLLLLLERAFALFRVRAAEVGDLGSDGGAGVGFGLEARGAAAVGSELVGAVAQFEVGGVDKGLSLCELGFKG